MRYLRVVETIRAKGHPNIRATHPTTLEVTVEENLTPRGDCVVAVGASKGAAGLSGDFKRAARVPGARVTLRLEAGGVVEEVRGWGDPSLSMSHPSDLVVRRSAFFCPRTVMIRSEKAAVDLNRRLVERLKRWDRPVSVALVVEVEI